MSEQEAAQIVDELLRKQVAALGERGGKPCEHLTLRAPYLPCPHPDCSGTQPVLRVARINPPTYGFWASSVTQPLEKTTRVEIWRRDWIGAVRAKTWQWRLEDDGRAARPSAPTGEK